MRRVSPSAIAVGVLVAVAVGLGVWDRVLAAQGDRLSKVLTEERIHIEKVTSLRRETRKTYVALLEGWVGGASPSSPSSPGAASLEKMLDTVREQHAAFQALPPSEPDELVIRERLTTALDAWIGAMAATLGDRAGAERLGDMRSALAKVDVEADGVLALNSASGKTKDAEVAALRTRRGTVQQGFFAALILAAGFAVVWRVRVRAAQRLAEAEKREADRAAAVRALFFASMSHELRTPLVAIRNLATTLKTDASDAGRAAASTQIEREAGDLLGSINNILDFAKLESDHVELLVEDVAIGGILDRCVKRCAPLVGDKPIDLRVEIAAGLPNVRADVVKLQQVFTNLLANAIKFTDEGAVVVRAGAEGEPGGRVRVDVEDSGIGIDPSAIKAVWEPFRQADKGIAAKYGGTGLGLPIVKGVLDRLGGEVSVRSEIGRGTTFTVLLPTASSSS